MGLQGWHLLIVLAVILLLFGAAKLPALAKSVGQSARVFKGEMKAMKEEDGPAETPAHQQPQAPTSVTGLTPPPAQGSSQGPTSSS
ncbi:MULTISPECIES: Sec-independent protein translocase subunit TatA [Microbacterium]|uniref:Sec-independent protein translocase subunit TatA n=1 Tax=Microbacterium TaxID=33882 RepID=UPI000766EDDA|nr:Sec-independent protein translocase subunit TatA [Microbacterium oleivorans]AZS43595.1 Sec-independent protein translocase protein TatA [Microbacterium oleivorans]THE08887.1 twin-arginine translocase TatA/TatE family subunit [Microbacterium oleivorans]